MPARLGRYAVRRRIGSGGFATVWLAYDEQLDSPVAIKVLAENWTEDSHVRQRFLEEGRYLRKVESPHVVTVYDAGSLEDDRPYLVMSYADQGTLADRLEAEGLTIGQASEVIRQVGEGLAALHLRGILHRDIKPANVLTNQFGWPALTDFGISSTVDEFAPTMTTTSRGSGNPAATGGGTASVGMSIPWSPPEMFDDEPNPDVRSDVFSLAATLYTVLAGHTPFEMPGRSNGSVDLIGRIARGAITPMPRADVPASLVAVLQKGMASDPKDRFATAVELGRALQRIEVELAFPQTPLDIPNIAIDRPERAAEGDESSADETRARVIPTIRAQAAPAAPAAVAPIVVPVVPVAPAPSETVVRRPSAPVDQTQLRSSQPMPSETVRRAPAAPDLGDVATAPRKPRRRGLVLSVIGGIVVVAGVIVVAAFVASAANPPTSVSSQGPGSDAGGPPAGEEVGVPKPSKPVGVLTSDGSGVQFSWTSPSPQSGDKYAWAPIVSGSPGTPSTTSELTTRVPYSGSQTCITVSIVRDGQESSPATGCYPK